MKSKNVKVLSMIVLLVLLFALFVNIAGCGDLFERPPVETEARHPTNYDPDIPSWEQIDPNDPDVSVVFFCDAGNFGGQNIESLIYKRTGVNITFQVALGDNHMELNTAIAGGKLPDVVILDDLSLRTILAEEGYCFPLNKLAEWYAPSMLKNVPQEHWDYFKSSDGNTYSLASHYYSERDKTEFDELGGQHYANGGILVRKDWMEEYIAYKQSQNPSFDPDKTITKPSGFFEMCQWVKSAKNIPNTVPTVLLSPFRTTAVNEKISYTVDTLTEAMGVPYEDENGDLVYFYDTPEFFDVVKFLNQLYRSNLVISANFAYSNSDINTWLVNGKSFAYIGVDQDHRAALATRELAGFDSNTKTISSSHQYVSIVLTNEAGDAPLMMDFAGRGLYHVMITRNCEREDRVIKVFDYLMSEQGMREITYGEVEGEYYNFGIRPGEINPKTNKPSIYGTIEPTEKYKQAIANTITVSPKMLGIGRMSPLHNPIYQRLTSEYNGAYINIFSMYDWIVYQNKKTYFGYTFPRGPFRYPFDTSDRKALNKHFDRQADIEKVWIDALPKMMMATSDAQLLQLYQDAVALSYAKGASEWIAFKNEAFKKNKQKLGIQYAWPKADPSYVPPEVKLFGITTNVVERPDWIYVKK